MPTNEYGQPTDSKGNVLTQSQVIEAELEQMIQDYRSKVADLVQDRHDHGITTEQLIALDTQAKKDLAALVLKHRHDVYFAAYRDGLQQGRKEGQAMLESSEEE